MLWWWCSLVALVFLLNSASGDGSFTYEVESSRQRRSVVTPEENSTTTTAAETTSAPTVTDKMTTQVDSARYYEVSHYANNMEQFWFDMPLERKHERLSTAYKTGIKIEMEFEFPFYGHNLNFIVLTTGGFIFTGQKIHRHLTKTQYIAPLMANFDATINPQLSAIYYYQNSSIFVAEWHNLHLNEHKDNATFYDPFRFQVQMWADGRIIFVYRNIPDSLSEIHDAEHPVKAGLADAYELTESEDGGSVTSDMIFEYSNTNIEAKFVTSGSTVIMQPKLTCHQMKGCNACLTTMLEFTCAYCPKTNRCSSGFDRYRTSWWEHNCNDKNVTAIADCVRWESMHRASTNPIGKSSSSGALGFLIALIVIILLALVVGLLGWLYFAHTHPNSPSGVWLIENRPSAVMARVRGMDWNGMMPGGSRGTSENTPQQFSTLNSTTGASTA